MDSAIEKVGLYDFFGVFLSGMLIVTICHYIGIPTIGFTNSLDNDFISVLIFLLASYFIGLVLQEFSSMLDRKICFLKFREKARSNFLNADNDVVENSLELQDYQNIGNKLLNKAEQPVLYSATECEYVYYSCKTFLELHSANDKVSRINSLFGMSRSFLIALPCIFCAYIYFNYSSLNVWIICALVLLTILFYKRSKRFSEYKVRVILRQYKLLSQKED